MAFDIAQALATLPPNGADPAATGTANATTATRVELGHGASLNDLGAFERALDGAALRIEGRRDAGGGMAAARALWRPFDHINGEAAALGSDARAAAAAGREMTPGELMSLTVRCQEFMFHCQLTSNIANRTSDGLQQLFRQQS